VDTAIDGAVAGEMLQLNKHDLLIIDNDIPVKSGIELIKKLFAARMALPVFLVSGTLPTE
jgi:response regulator of citrate/malate metabolism